MKTVVTYESKTGFTKKYAEWIATDLACDLKEASSMNASDIAGYDLVIHGGWIMAGMIKGLNKVRALQPKKLVVFGVGITPKEEMETDKLNEANKLEGTPLFYYEGGQNPSKMGLIGRAIVKMATKKTPEYVDHANRNEIAELVNRAKEISKEI